MKRVVFYLNFSLLLFFYGCNTSIEDKIKDKFMDYANENFDNPNDIEEITSVIKTDSSDVKSLFADMEKIVNDSTDFELYPEKILEKLESLPPSQRYALKEYVQEYVDQSLDFMNFKLVNDNQLKYLSDSIRSYISKIKLSDYDCVYNYEIKVRTNKMGVKKISKFYAIVNKKTKKITIQDHKLKDEEVPILKDIYKIMDKYIELRKEYMYMYINLRNLENKLFIKL